MNFLKVVFPCKGSMVLTKSDIETLRSFYNTKLMTSKLYEYSKNSEFVVQVDNFNYIPKTYTLFAKQVNFMTIRRMREILGLTKPIPKELEEQSSPQPANNVTPQVSNDEDEKISDKTLLSHPFFKTLKPL